MIDSVSDFKVDEPHIDHYKIQSNEEFIVENEVSSEPIVSPSKVRRSARSNKDIPPTRCGSITSHRVNATKKFGNWLSSISKKIDILYDHVFDWLIVFD